MRATNDQFRSGKLRESKEQRSEKREASRERKHRGSFTMTTTSLSRRYRPPCCDCLACESPAQSARPSVFNRALHSPTTPTTPGPAPAYSADLPALLAALVLPARSTSSAATSADKPAATAPDFRLQAAAVPTAAAASSQVLQTTEELATRGAARGGRGEREEGREKDREEVVEAEDGENRRWEEGWGRRDLKEGRRESKRRWEVD